MSGAPVIGFLPSAAYAFEGDNKERERREKSRAANRKALQELADQAAAQGRQLSIEEWAQMVQSTVGSEGMLYGYAPTAQAIEQIRQTQNMAAEQKKREQQFAEFERKRKEDTSIDQQIEELVRSGKGNEEIVAEIAQNYGDPAIAQRVLPRLNGARSRVNQKDVVTGTQIGGTLMSEDEVDNYLKENSYASETHKAAVKQASQRARETELRRIAYDVSPYFQTPEQEALIRQKVRENLPEALRQSANADKYVEQVMTIVKGRRAEAQGLDTRNVAVAGATAQQQAIPQDVRVTAELEAKERAETEAAKREAIALFEKQRNADKEGVTKLFDKIVTDKNTPSKVKEAAATARDAMLTYSFPNEQEIMQFVMEGDVDGVKKAIARGQRLGAVSRESLIEVHQNRALIQRGIGFSENMDENYSRRFGIYDRTQLPALREMGMVLSKLKEQGPGKAADLQAAAQAIAAQIADNVKQTRTDLDASGRFSASPEQLAQMEAAAVRRTLATLRAGGAPTEVVNAIEEAVIAQIGQAPGIKGTPRPSQTYMDRRDSAAGRTGAPTIFRDGGGGASLPPPPGGAAPRYGW